MRVFPLVSLLLSIFLTIVSCSDDSSASDGDNPSSENVLDDFYYLALKKGSYLYRIGNKTGNTEEIMRIPGMGELVIFNAVTVAPSKVFIGELSLQPFRYFIHVYDKATGEFTKNFIELPEESFGSRAIIVSMDWDSLNDRMIAIVTSDEGSPNGNSVLAEVDPITFEVGSLGVDLGQGFVTISTTLKGSKLYASNVTGPNDRQFDDFFEIDVENKTFRSMGFNNIERGLTNINGNPINNTIFGYTYISNPPIASSGEPFLLNLDSGAYEALLQDLEVVNLGDTFKTFYDTSRQIYVSILRATSGTFIYEHHATSHEENLLKIEENGTYLGGSAIIDIIN